MSAPTRWRDDRGRLWGKCEHWTSLRLRPVGWEPDCIALSYYTVESLCGPLTPVEPMARVRVPNPDSEDARCVYVTNAARCGKMDWRERAVSIPLARAEEIAAAFRTLGYTDATVEEIA